MSLAGAGCLLRVRLGPLLRLRPTFVVAELVFVDEPYSATADLLVLHGDGLGIGCLVEGFFAADCPFFH